MYDKQETSKKQGYRSTATYGDNIELCDTARSGHRLRASFVKHAYGPYAAHVYCGGTTEEIKINKPLQIMISLT